MLFVAKIGGPAFAKGLRRGRQECPLSVNSSSGAAGSLCVLGVLCESLFLIPHWRFSAPYPLSSVKSVVFFLKYDFPGDPQKST